MMVDVTSRSRSSVLAMQAVCALLLTAPFLRDVYGVTAEPTDGPSSPVYWMRESAVGVALVAALVLCWATARQGERGARTWAVVALILVGIRGVGNTGECRQCQQHRRGGRGAGLRGAAGPLRGGAAGPDSPTVDRLAPGQRCRSGSVTSPMACTALPEPPARE